MKYLYLKDLLLEIPTQVTNTTGSLTGIKGLLIQVRTLSKHPTSSGVAEGQHRVVRKRFFILAVLSLVAAFGPVGHTILPSHSFPSFLLLNPSHPAH